MSQRNVRIAAFLLTFFLLLLLQIKVDRPMLLLDRLLPGTAYLEILVLAIYAAWLAGLMLDGKRAPAVRQKIWKLFSFVFFSQFILGLAGLENFLMTGKLHLPVPAMIVAGPVYRGSGVFMPILLLSTILIAGSAWCSHLCYVGSWDLINSYKQRIPGRIPTQWKSVARWSILVLTVLTAGILRLLKIETLVSTSAGIIFGLCGVGVMLIFSRSRGVMIHCVAYCPIGLIVNFLGRLNPFRIKFTDSCDGCGVCSRTCRYDALGQQEIEERKPGFSCTLCGDCLPSCRSGSLTYSFFKMGPEISRSIFIAIVVSLHAIFLGVARI